MKNIKNKKGFTLVELLVAISILGTIMIIALPQLSNLQSNNQKTKYKKYAETMLTSAKLYTDSYTEDMFGNDKSGCFDIPYSEMKDKNLLKDIKISNSTCASENTFVRVKKTNDYYIYETSIYCTDKNGKVVYDKRLNKDTCNGDGPDTDGPKIEITPTSKGWTKGTNEKVTVKVWDEYGMLENTKVKFTWTKDGKSYGQEVTYSYKNKRYEGTEDSKLTYSFKIPQNETGIFVLTVTPIDIRDSIGNYKTEKVTSGEYKLDNTAPSEPTINLKKWSSNEENNRPTNETNNSSLITYTAGNWSNKNIFTYPSGSSDDHVGGLYYQYTTTGATENETNVKQNYRSIEAEGTSNIKWIACDKLGNCSSYTLANTINIDKTAPTCTVSGGSPSWTNKNVTVTGNCSDENGSGCTTASTTVSQTFSSEGDTTGSPGTVYDKAGNFKKCETKPVKIDKTAPTITGVSGPTKTCPGSKDGEEHRRVEITVNDTGGSGLAGFPSITSYTHSKYSGTGRQTDFAHCNSNTTDYPCNPGSYMQYFGYSTNNTNTLTLSDVTVTDNAGNSKTYTITCPYNSSCRYE